MLIYYYVIIIVDTLMVRVSVHFVFLITENVNYSNM